MTVSLGGTRARSRRSLARATPCPRLHVYVYLLHLVLISHQSAEYASFHERMKSIDWKTEDEEILRAVAEAVANLPPPTTTND